MRVLVIDGQGGGLGKQLVTAVKGYDRGIEVIAIRRRQVKIRL